MWTNWACSVGCWFAVFDYATEQLGGAVEALEFTSAYETPSGGSGGVGGGEALRIYD